MSRHGVLPEADFYCPIRGSRWRLPLPPPSKRPLRRGSDALLDRIFELIVKELEYAAPTGARRSGFVS